MTRDTIAGQDLVRRGLKFSQLRLLAALREHGRIGAAAQQAGITQPAASRLLAQLDGLVGAPLYERHARGVTLTEAGRILADEACAALRGFDLAGQRIGQVVSGVRGHVRVGSVTGPALEILLPAIRAARDILPEIDPSVTIDTSDKLGELLRAEEIDFYIGRIPEGADARPYALREIGPEPVALIVREDHPLVGVDPLDLDQCLSHIWVMQPAGGLLRRTAETYLLAHGHRLPDRVVGTTSQLFTLALVQDSNAIAPLARAVADFFIARGGLGSRLARLPVATDMQVPDYGLITRAPLDLTPAALRLYGLVAAECRRDGAAPPPAAGDRA